MTEYEINVAMSGANFETSVEAKSGSEAVAEVQRAIHGAVAIDGRFNYPGCPGMGNVRALIEPRNVLAVILRNPCE